MPGRRDIRRGMVNGGLLECVSMRFFAWMINCSHSRARGNSHVRPYMTVTVPISRYNLDMVSCGHERPTRTMCTRLQTAQYAPHQPPGIHTVPPMAGHHPPTDQRSVRAVSGPISCMRDRMRKRESSQVYRKSSQV